MLPQIQSECKGYQIESINVIELVVEERARTNRPRAYLIKCMDGILSPPLVFLWDRPAFKLNITRVCVLSVPHKHSGACAHTHGRGI